MENHKFTNALIHETSPYLLQHAHNPVNWMPWGDVAMHTAKIENKPMLISIGYSACHWCHVMEYESFEDEQVAAIMNAHFVCIKVDREERPDIDQVYMDAVQIMTSHGGWPLNCFAMPDGRPFYGGTYFRKEQWIQILENLANTYQNDIQRVDEYAENLKLGLLQMGELPVTKQLSEFSDEVLETAVNRWTKQFDHTLGGPNYAPKFPLPNNYLFLMAWAETQGERDLMNFVHHTLKRMSYGGIYDHLGGGFARYSVDAYWKVPHFEKMLYDNAQLMCLYSAAHKQSKNPHFLEVAVECATWIAREMTNEEGLFYSALDADSEGKEGKFYVWKEAEVKDLAGANFLIISDYFNFNSKGLWEHGNYIPLRDLDNLEIAEKQGISIEDLATIISAFKTAALERRSERIRPGLDDKCLTSWNAMCSKGLIDVYKITDDEQWLELAEKNLGVLMQKRASNGTLFHSHKNGKSTITGFLEDYAHLCDALIACYEVTFNEHYLRSAKEMMDFVLAHFDRNVNGFFYFKSNNDAQLVAPKADTTDNVIPSSNSVMATCAWKLGLIYGEPELLELVRKMLSQLEPHFVRHPSGYSQWMTLFLWQCEPFYELAVIGPDALSIAKEIREKYLPNVLICGSETHSSVPILKDRFKEGETLIYVCENGACQMPVRKTEEALALM